MMTDDLVGFSVLLALIHGAEGILWFAASTLSAQSFMRWLRQPAILTWLNRITGGAFVVFGVRLAFDQRRLGETETPTKWAGKMEPQITQITQIF